MFLSFCALGQNSRVKNDTLYKSVGIQKDDATFLALKGVAQKHLSEFISDVKSHGRDVDNFRFVVKSDFIQDGEHEHMWSQVYGYSNGIFKAIFIDSPFKITNIKTGVKIEIKEGLVEDWIIDDLKYKKQKGYFSKQYLKGKE